MRLPFPLDHDHLAGGDLVVHTAPEEGTAAREIGRPDCGNRREESGRGRHKCLPFLHILSWYDVCSPESGEDRRWWSPPPLDVSEAVHDHPPELQEID